MTGWEIMTLLNISCAVILWLKLPFKLRPALGTVYGGVGLTVSGFSSYTSNTPLFFQCFIALVLGFSILAWHVRPRDFWWFDKNANSEA